MIISRVAFAAPRWKESATASSARARYGSPFPSFGAPLQILAFPQFRTENRFHFSWNCSRLGSVSRHGLNDASAHVRSGQFALRLLGSVRNGTAKGRIKARQPGNDLVPGQSGVADL